MSADRVEVLGQMGPSVLSLSGMRVYPFVVGHLFPQQRSAMLTKVMHRDSFIPTHRRNSRT